MAVNDVSASLSFVITRAHRDESSPFMYKLLSSSHLVSYLEL